MPNFLNLPDTQKTLISRALSLISVLAAAGSGFISGVAPPEDEGKSVAYGWATVSAIFAYLLIRAF